MREPQFPRDHARDLVIPSSHVDVVSFHVSQNLGERDSQFAPTIGASSKRSITLSIRRSYRPPRIS